MYKYLILLLALSLFTNASAQHDPGRNAVRRISHGKIDSAVNIIKKGARKKNSPLNQAEKNFVLAMAACRVDNPEIAARYAAKAVKMGLPIQRIQAGPRKILAPLYHQKNFKTWLNKKKKKLIHGPMLGSVTDSRAKFWLRTEKEENVKIAINPLRKTPSGTLRHPPVNRPIPNLLKKRLHHNNRGLRTKTGYPIPISPPHKRPKARTIRRLQNLPRKRQTLQIQHRLRRRRRLHSTT